MNLILLLVLVGTASGWSNQDVGSPSVAGSAAYDANTNTWIITADGNDIWWHSDNFHYIYKYLKGDGQITAQVESITGPGTDGWAKAGVMIRENLSGESKHAMMVMTPDFGAAFQWRSNTSDISYNVNKVGLVAPYWVRLIRSGDTFTGYYSSNNKDWIRLGEPINIPMNKDVYIGLVLTSHQEGVLRSAEFGFVRVISTGQAGIRYDDPPDGWLYTYTGNHAAAGTGGYTALDGTWSHENNSDRWDGTTIGTGRPGGASELSQGGANFLRLQDTGNPVYHGMPDPSNRKIMFAHSITYDIGPWGDDILDRGITISFRARISKTPPLDDLHPDGSGITPWPAGGDGYVTHDGGKGNFSIRQSEGIEGKIISFTLAHEDDHSFLGDRRGLAMNSTDGNTPSANVDIYDSEGTLNLLKLDTTIWHEFWITIGPKAGRRTGTHMVNVYMDGSESPDTFYVTAGNGFDYPDSYIAIGVGATPQSGAIDIDFFSYKPGIYPPVNNLNKWSQPPVEIDPNSKIPIYCGWDEPSYRELIDSLWFDCWDCRTQCRGDADCNGHVGSADMTIVMDAYNKIHPDPGYDPCADFDRNLSVDFLDLIILQQNWETNPPADCNQRRYTWHFVADDFRCFGSMPVASVRWWGSYLGWVDFEPPAVQPIAWHIGFWSNVPEDFMGFSYPERLLWSLVISADRVRSEYAGNDNFPEKPPDSCFRYEVKLSPKEYFRQEDFRADTFDDIFWISIVAIYPDSADITNPWGWKTRPLPWMDDAVTFSLSSPPYFDLVTDPNFIIPIENTMGCGYVQSYDVAFELGTDADYIKAAQPYTGLRYWPHYDGNRSNAVEEPDGTIVTSAYIPVDDWLCERRTPVTAAVWWGTYHGLGYEACMCPVEEEPNEPDYFLLTIWNNTPAGVDLSFSHPNEVIWQYKAYDYDEVMVGYDKNPVCIGCDEPNWPVFRYSVQLPTESWFRQKDVNETYWFSVVAVYENYFPIKDWFWTNHELVSENSSVNLRRDMHMHDNYEDMSFMLFTDPGECINCADYNSDNIVNFIDYADFSDDWNWTGPPGGYNNADLNCDGKVDFHDLDIFTLQWLSSCP